MLKIISIVAFALSLVSCDNEEKTQQLEREIAGQGKEIAEMKRRSNLSRELLKEYRQVQEECMRLVEDVDTNQEQYDALKKKEVDLRDKINAMDAGIFLPAIFQNCGFYTFYSDEDRSSQQD